MRYHDRLWYAVQMQAGDDNGTTSKYDLTKPNQHINVSSVISC